MKKKSQVRVDSKASLQHMVRDARALVITAESLNPAKPGTEFTKEEMKLMRMLVAQISQRFHEYNAYGNVLEVERDN